MKTLRATLLGVLFCAGMALVAMPATAQGGGETIECEQRDSESITCNGETYVEETSLEQKLRDWLDAELDRRFRPDEQLDRNGNGGGDSGGGGGASNGGGGGSAGGADTNPGPDRQKRKLCFHEQAGGYYDCSPERRKKQLEALCKFAEDSNDPATILGLIVAIFKKHWLPWLIIKGGQEGVDALCGMAGVT